MKILHVSESDNIGGAAIAASRLNSLLLSFGIDSKLLVNRKKSDNSNIIAPTTFINLIYAKLLPHLLLKYYKLSLGTTTISLCLNRSTPFFLNALKKEDYDIIHLHWVNNGFVGFEELIKTNKPVVWTLHDNWLFTAGCHTTQDCVGFLSSCESCPKLSSYSYQTILNQNFEKKFNQLQKLKNKVRIIVPSRWMYENAIKSKLLSDFKIDLIPNFIDTEIYLPMLKKNACDTLGLDHNKKYILFGASDPLNDFNKGYHYIRQMDLFGTFNGFNLIIFGKINNINSIDLNVPYILMDTIFEREKLVSLYNAAEMVLVPSIHESFGQVAAESLSCGIPVLAFDTTGLKDVIDHKINGYLARKYNVEDLINGFNWIISQKKLNKFAREKVVNNFSKDIIAKKIILFYESLIENKGIK